MARQMRKLVSAAAVVLCLGVGAPALATGIFDRDELFFDREDLAEELILRDRLFGPPFGRPFIANRPFFDPFIVNRPFFNPFIANRPFGNPFIADPFDFDDDLFFEEEFFDFEEDEDD